MSKTAGASGVPIEVAVERGIAFLCHPYHRGGVTRWMVDAAAEFRRRGVPVWFVSPEPRTPFRTGAGRPTMTSLVRALSPAERPMLLAPTVGIPFELGTHAYRAAVYATAVNQEVPLGVPVIVSDDPAVWAGAAAVSEGNPMIGVLHSDESIFYGLARMYRSKATFVGVSRRIANKVAREHGITVPSIPCGVSMRAPLDDTRSPNDVSRLIWIGRIEEFQKRVSDLPAIGAALHARGIAFDFVIVGDGPQREQLCRDILAIGLGQQIRLLGWMDQNSIWSLLCASDVLVLPSNFEGMPVVVMEALSAGCSVVASRVSGLEDVADGSYPDYAFATYARGDVEAAAALVARTLEVPSPTRRQDARAMAKELFSISGCVDRYEQVIAGIQGVPADASVRVSGTFVPGLLSFPLAIARSIRRSINRWRDT